ncbi:cytochrome P450 [Fusarium redolens]|uniref:Cytochrome P450 n=1 Tax=Fusarium redolens TaxID=48865 RepID=A0A9P9FXS3_FUSRE|nr:cytochrome P450 [Fusarium redolens]KAH7213259.1 cytochrome P450 [Fusarium redolens]
MFGVNILTVSLFILTARVVYGVFTSWYRLRSFPGPFVAAVSKLWIVRGVLNKSLHLDLKQVCEEYGSFVRVSPNDIVTDSLDHALAMSSVRSPYRRSEIYSNVKFDFEMDHVFSERDENRHQSLRRKLSAGYSGKENTHLEAGIDGQIRILVDLIDSKYLSTQSSKRTLEFSRLAQFFTLDVITEVAFGQAFGFLSRDEDINGYCHVAEQALPVFEWLGVFGTLNKMIRLPGIRNLTMPRPTDKTGVGMMMGYAKKIVSERFDSTKVPRDDMLGSFERHGLSSREAETEATLQIMAGSDTTVTALRSTLLFIMTNPVIYAKVQKELEAAYQDQDILTAQGIICDAATQKLTYLLACIRESIRMLPPAFAMLQKQTPPEGDLLPDGRFIPGGTRVGTCVYGIVRSKAIFGEDADVYRPERWIEADNAANLDPENNTSSAKVTYRRMIQAADIVFGSGRYQCLGKTVAMFELRKTLATLLHRYDIVSVNPSQPWVSVPANGLLLQSDMWVKVTARENTESL